MKNIDQLQNAVHNLRNQRAAGTPAGDEEKQIQASLNGLKTHYTTYKAQLEGAPDGVHVAREHLGFLQSYALNALQDAQSVVSNMERNPPAENTPLDVLPFHVGLLSPLERVQFQQDLDIVGNLLEGREGPIAPDDVENLLEAASRLGEHNSRCKGQLDSRSRPGLGNDPAQFKPMYDSIDQFQRALNHAVEQAIARESPAPRTVVPERVSGGVSLDRSVSEIRRILALGKDRRLSNMERVIVGRHRENVRNIVSTRSQALTEAVQAERSILAEIADDEEAPEPRSADARSDSSDDDLYTSPPPRRAKVPVTPHERPIPFGFGGSRLPLGRRSPAPMLPPLARGARDNDGYAARGPASQHDRLIRNTHTSGSSISDMEEEARTSTDYEADTDSVTEYAVSEASEDRNDDYRDADEWSPTGLPRSFSRR
jgi:hypothetical protein